MNNRRNTELDSNAWWQNLSMAQKFSANSLNRYGYDLKFVRSTVDGSLAVFAREDELATILDAGEIDLNPSLVLRRQEDLEKA